MQLEEAQQVDNTYYCPFVVSLPEFRPQKDNASLTPKMKASHFAMHQHEKDVRLF
jgi:hypothetical protein